MTLISLMIILIVIGVALHLIFRYIPMEPAIKTLILVVVVIVVCLWLLQVFGIGDIPLRTIPYHR